jgi:hypothetical protein
LPTRIIVPAKVLQEAPGDALIVLRLGAAANALQTLLLLERGAPERPHMSYSRDLVHVFVMVASYIREVSYILGSIDENRLWELATHGIKAGRELPWETLDEVKALLDKDHPMQRRAHDIRRQLGFHVLPADFRSWLKAKTARRARRFVLG